MCVRTCYCQMLAPNLTFTVEDVGSVIQMFSFRYDCWGEMTITDFDVQREVHKCRYRCSYCSITSHFVFVFVFVSVNDFDFVFVMFMFV